MDLCRGTQSLLLPGRTFHVALTAASVETNKEQMAVAGALLTVSDIIRYSPHGYFIYLHRPWDAEGGGRAVEEEKGKIKKAH